MSVTSVFALCDFTEDSYTKTLELDDGTIVELDITDTAGQEEFRYDMARSKILYTDVESFSIN